MRDSIIEKWENELENGDLLDLEFIIAGLPEGYYKDNLDEALEFAIDSFVMRHNLSEKTKGEMYDVILIRDAFYKMLEREGLL